METLLHRTITVRGRVQGVRFRQSAMEQARQLGLHGTAQNLASGAVVIHVEGDRNALEVFTEWARKGPLLSYVAHCDHRDGPAVGLTGQTIIR